MKKILPTLLTSIFYLLLMPSISLAHTSSDSFLRLSQEGKKLAISWDISLLDLEYAIGIDSNADGNISGNELKENARKASDYALSYLTIKSFSSNNNAQETLCTLSVSDTGLSRRNQKSYLSIQAKTDCRADGTLLLDYRLFHDIDPSHNGILSIDLESAQYTRLLDKKNSTHRIQAQSENSLKHNHYLGIFIDFITEGIWHIWIGFDHILFLLTLLLPAALLIKDKQWQTETKKSTILIRILKLVTVFTLAHSFTLSLSVFNIVSLPSKWVEVTIAFSIIVVAANNIKPIFSHSHLVFAFIFGLIHGFGFANVLLDLSLPQSALALSLLGFNIGVELGQLVIIALFIPIIISLRHRLFYRKTILPFASLSTALIAAIWTFERVGGYTIIS